MHSKSHVVPRGKLMAEAWLPCECCSSCADSMGHYCYPGISDLIVYYYIILIYLHSLHFGCF